MSATAADLRSLLPPQKNGGQHMLLLLLLLPLLLPVRVMAGTRVAMELP
jgi:hypothetical protein